jgi:arabinose-5-phosphate isomerase
MNYIRLAQNAIDVQLEAILALRDSLGDEFLGVVELLLNTKGRIVLCGVGKSGIIAQKVAAVFSSIGCSSFFVHANEASHGDLGAIMHGDVIIILSNSGDTKELVDTISYCKIRGIKIVAIVGRRNSVLFDTADIALVLPKFSEISQAISFPSTSITMMSVLGDLLTLCLVEAKKITHDQYRKFHPGGSIGNSLLKINEIMRKNGDLPVVKAGTKILDAILVMSEKSIGCIVVVDNKDKFCGIITDGDLRRHFDSDFVNKNVEDIMTKKPKSISGELRAIDALNYMNDKRITQLMVVDKAENIVGLIHMHDCLRAGLKIENE